MIDRETAEELVVEGIMQYFHQDFDSDDTVTAEEIAKDVIDDLFTHNRPTQSPGDLMQILTG